MLCIIDTLLTPRFGRVHLQGQIQALAHTVEHSLGASHVLQPVAVEQALMQNQFQRAQTHVGDAACSSQGGISLAHLSSVDGSCKSGSTDADLSRKFSVSSPADMRMCDV
ncbi:hypothetical protein DUNSADRAFT_7619 [Dunaliella salina]|uniref:Encoded protein n=1 Tax=Dunaliella salina TaxID=3046 RepID=A0ABQ7GL05_DUNSA|nr:hypothetical protein DUNSADRAFT_7619 [Dunaliella salina]|eukprot:KAF5835294.1 hypothetical protein DUNSADRAFT_7619 [Dunaliella salina]